MNESEKNTLGELTDVCKGLDEKQKAYLCGVVDGMKASKEKENKE